MMQILVNVWRIKELWNKSCSFWKNKMKKVFGASEVAYSIENEEYSNKDFLRFSKLKVKKVDYSVFF